MQVAETSEASGVKSYAERSEEYAVVRFPFQLSLLAVSQLLKHTADELPALLYYRLEQNMYYDGMYLYREKRASSYIGDLERCTLTASDTTLMFTVKQAESEGQMPRWSSIEFDVSGMGSAAIPHSKKALIEKTKRMMQVYLEQRHDELKYVSTRMPRNENKDMHITPMTEELTYEV